MKPSCFLPALLTAGTLALGGLAPAATFTVTNNAATGPGSLHQAILDANANPGPDVITFNIAGANRTITPPAASPLPVITDPVTIDGTTQPGFAGVPLIELNGASGPAGSTGLHLSTSNSIIRGLVINRWKAHGVRLDGGGGHVIEGCYLGVSLTGAAAQGNTLHGVFIENSAGNRVGGSTATQRNVISGNSQHGVRIQGAGATGNLIQGSLIGLNATGAAVLRNTQHGVSIEDAADTQVGGPGAGEGNVISGNGQHGIFLGAGTARTLIRGNLVGLSADGATRQPNSQDGVHLAGATGTVIGGSAAGAGNAVSGNAGDGIELGAGTADTQIVGNVIGLRPAGDATANNANRGIFVNGAADTRIGGPDAGAGNVISGNSQHGIAVAGAGTAGVVIQGNLIGPDAGGALDLGNTQDGINVAAGAGVVIGGTTAGARNVISGNNGEGIELTGAGVSAVVIEGNFIGTDRAGTAALGNSSHGVLIASNASRNRVGGVTAGQANRIAFNGGDGVYISGGVENPVRGNSIHSNAGLGIDLGGNGVTNNDATDADTGANQLQNFPVLAEAVLRTAATEVRGSLQTSASGTFTLDFYASDAADPTGHGEGEVWLGAVTVTTDASGFAGFTANVATTGLRFISATATDLAGNTSEFSATRRAVTTATPADFVVTNTADSGPGSLRQAILDANAALNEGDRIVFNIPGNGPHTIAPVSALPALAAPVTLDGYAQPGAQPNTLADGFNAALQIVLDGNVAPNNTDGLRVEAPRVTLRGLALTRWKSDGIEILAAAAGVVIEGCVIGLGPDGSRLGQTSHGIHVAGSGGHRIGGTAPAARNVISGNNAHGILLTGAGARDNVVEGSFIGTGLDGTTREGNSQDGVQIVGGAGNRIGGTSPGAGNVIGGNNSDGIEVQNASGTVIQGNRVGIALSGADLRNGSHGVHLSNASDTLIGGVAAGAGNVIARNSGRGVVVANNASLRNVIRGNSIFANGNLGIDLANNGVTQNDPGDADTGPNGLQNFPVLATALAGEAATRLTGAFNSKPGAAFTLEFFSSTAADPTGFGEGEQFLGAAEVTTDAEGNAAFDLTLPARAIGRAITATATGADGTSEFSAVRRAESTIPGRTFTVTTADDAGPGSLRQALLDADAVMTGPPHRIVFAIPGDGPHTISPASALPTPASEPVAIDGFTQPGASANTLAAGFNAVHRVILDGTAAPFGVPGLRFDTSGNIVRGLVIVNFKESGIRLRGDGNAVEGCLLGVMPDGEARPNSRSGVSTESAATGSRVGGVAPAARNVIAGNGQSNVILDSSGASEVFGNWIGLTPAGTAAPAPRPDFFGTTLGVEILQGADHLIGGVAPGAGNVIGGHNGAAVAVRNAVTSRVRVLGNVVGTDASGVTSVPNGLGIEVSNSSGNVFGGVLPGEGNLIAFSTSVGVRISGFGATGRNAIRGNRIFGNTGIGIDLGFDGVTPNDPGDADDGPNRLQNFPVLTAATATAGSVTITGTLSSRPELTCTLDFFANDLCDPRGHGQGGQYLGSTTVVTDAGGLGAFAVTLPATITGRYLTATATDPEGNTSEFSACFEAVTDFPAETFTVTTTADAGPGSLRAALERNNASVAGSRNRIVFAIPGAGPQVIAPASPLPGVLHAVEIDGYSQPNARPNTLAAGSDAVILVRLDRGPTSGFLGLRLAGEDSVVRGLAFTGWFQALELQGERHAVLGCFFGFQPEGTAVENTFSIVLAPGGADHRIGSPAPADRNVVGRSASAGLIVEGRGARVQGNLFGLTPAGEPAASGVAISVNAGTDHRIGGPAPGAGNVIAHASREGILVRAAEGTVIQGNFIGTDPVGLSRRGNQNGIQLELSARNTLVGGVTPGARNVISGNQNIGLIAGQDAVIQGNFIGVAADGVTPLGNTVGVFINGPGNRLGGPGAGEGNVIAHHGFEGVRLVAGDAVRNAIRGNRIFGNVGLGIELGGFGITPNDPQDADTGPNQLQNFPEITAGSLNADTVQVAGGIESRPDTVFALDFFANRVPSGSGAGEGEQYLGSAAVTTGPDGRGVFEVTLPAVGVGRFLTATATDPDGNTSEFSRAFRAGSTRPPQTFVVTTAADDGPGSLRQVLLEAGGHPAGTAHLIRFAIAGEGVRTIALQSPLPEPDEPFLLDGFTQPGASPNTAADADNAVRLVRLDAAALNFNEPALRLTRAGSGARGLIVAGGGGSGIELAGEGGHTVAGCLVAGNRASGIRIIGSTRNRIGGALPADRNIIINQATGPGIQVSGAGARDNRILGNFLGVAADGISPARNFDGVLVDDGAGLQIGGAAPGEGNVIAFHQRSGVVVRDGVGTVLRGNRIFGNQQLGMDLAPIGVTANDAGDADAGPNGLQNFPVIEAADVVAGGTRLRGTLNSRPQATFLLEFFHNQGCHFSSHGPGERPIATTTVTTDAQGNAAFDFTIAQTVPRGVVTATATGDAGTSEFSACRAVDTTLPPQTFTVTTIEDDGPGSLRQAIRDANAAFTTGRSTIAFNLPGTGVRTIQPLSPLPAITGPTLLDGFSQPGAAPDASDATLKHVLLVRLDGQRAGPGTHGLSVSGRPVEIRGLMITRFDSAGVAVSGPLAQVDVQGCWIGTDGVTGVGPQAAGGRSGGPALQRAPANPAARVLGNGTGLAQFDGQLNVGNSIISGNLSDGVFQAGGQFFGNLSFFGLDPAGEHPLGNARDGIHCSGGTTEIVDCVLSGNARHGLFAGGDTPAQTRPPNRIETRHSYFGTSPNAVRQTGNGGAGLHLNNVSPFSQVSVFNNSIGGNAGPGVFLGAGLLQGSIFNNGFGVRPPTGRPGEPLDFLNGHIPEPNFGPGIEVNGSRGIKIGGPGDGEPNLFKHNAGPGVLVHDGFDIPFAHNVFGAGQLPVNASPFAPRITGTDILDETIRYLGQFSPLGPSFPPGSSLILLTPDPQNPDCFRPSSVTPIIPAPDASFDMTETLFHPLPPAVAAFAADPFGNSSSGRLTPLTPQGFDFGDAPDSYQTLLASNGPRHARTHDRMVILGGGWTGEADGQPGPDADGDGPSDDGVILPAALVPGSTAQIGLRLGFSTTGGPGVPEGWVSGWIDFDGNGRFEDPAERVVFRWVVGSANISVPVPASARPGRTYARFRASSVPLHSPVGLAPDGEVEDYSVMIGPEVFEPIRIHIARDGTGANLTVIPATKAVFFEVADGVTGTFQPLNQTPSTQQFTPFQFTNQIYRAKYAP